MVAMYQGFTVYTGVLVRYFKGNFLSLTSFIDLIHIRELQSYLPLSIYIILFVQLLLRDIFALKY